MLSVDDDSIEGSFLCTADDALAAGGMPIDVMLIEAMAQFAGGLAFRDRPGHGYLSAIDRCSIDRMIVAGGVESMSRIPMASDGGAWSVDPEPYLAPLRFRPGVQ